MDKLDNSINEELMGPKYVVFYPGNAKPCTSLIT